MALTRDILLERKASLEADRNRIVDAVQQMQADLNASEGAIQQVVWDLAQLDEEPTEEDA